MDVTKNINFVKNNVIDNIKYTIIHESCVHGFGLFATQPLLQGTILCVLDGQINK